MSGLEDPNRPSFICMGCDCFYSRRSAPNAVEVGDFWFCSPECHAHAFDEGRLGLT